MTYKDAIRQFKENFDFPPNDKPAAGEAWCIFVDTLAQEGKITPAQAMHWDNPFYH